MKNRIKKNTITILIKKVKSTPIKKVKKGLIGEVNEKINELMIKFQIKVWAKSDRGDVPGWVLVVLMTAGLVTGIWTVAAPRLNTLLRNSLDSMNAIR